MEPLDYYLSDKFTEFSAQIKVLNDEKTALKTNFKAVYDKYQQDLAAIESKGQKLLAEFEAWKAAQSKAVPLTIAKS